MSPSTTRSATVPSTRTQEPAATRTSRESRTSNPTSTASAAQQLTTRRDTVASASRDAGVHVPVTAIVLPSTALGAESNRSSASNRSPRKEVGAGRVLTVPGAGGGDVGRQSAAHTPQTAKAKDRPRCAAPDRPRSAHHASTDPVSSVAHAGIEVRTSLAPIVALATEAPAANATTERASLTSRTEHRPRSRPRLQELRAHSGAGRRHARA